MIIARSFLVGKKKGRIMAVKNTRHWAKKKLTQSIGNLNACATYLSEVSSVYKDLHPEISEPLDTCLIIFAEIESLIDKTEKSI